MMVHIKALEYVLTEIIKGQCTDENGRVDSKGFREFAIAIRWLADMGKITITHDVQWDVKGVWLNK